MYVFDVIRKVQKSKYTGNGYSKYDPEGRVVYYERRDGFGDLIQHFCDYDQFGRRCYYADMENGKIVYEERYIYDSADPESERWFISYNPVTGSLHKQRQHISIWYEDDTVKYDRKPDGIASNDKYVNTMDNKELFAPYPLKLMKELNVKTRKFFDEIYDTSNY